MMLFNVLRIVWSSYWDIVASYKKSLLFEGIILNSVAFMKSWSWLKITLFSSKTLAFDDVDGSVLSFDFDLDLKNVHRPTASKIEKFFEKQTDGSYKEKDN